MNTAMQCKDVQQQIDARPWSGASLSADVRAHLERCELCRHRYNDAVLNRLLLSQQVPPPPPGFVDAAICDAVLRNRRQGRFWMGAAAASLALLTVAAVLRFAGATRELAIQQTMQQVSAAQTSQVDPMVQVSLTPQQYKTVQVLIGSVDSHDSATITVALAENLELEGFPNEQVIEWRTSLKQGNNLLALPVRLKDAQASHFEVAFSYGEIRKQVRVDVGVAPVSSSSSTSVTSVI